MSAILFSVENKVAYITINRPQVLNAINAEVRKGLTEAWIRVRDDDDVWAAILTGAGDKAFTAGADIKEFSEFQQGKEGSVEPYYFPRPTQDLGLWKPIIAAIDGYCLGGGLVLAMDCDIRVATERAIFGMPEVVLSQVPGWWAATRAAQYLPLGKALEFFMTGSTFSAQEAERLGLVNYVVPPSQLMAKAEEIVHKINENGPLAVRGIKECIYRGLSSPLPEAARLEDLMSRLSMESEDAKEGARAFLEKRKPQYKGR